MPKRDARTVVETKLQCKDYSHTASFYYITSLVTIESRYGKAPVLTLKSSPTLLRCVHPLVIKSYEQ